MAYNKRLLFAPNGHKIDYLVIGGGGGAGTDMGGGGGAGGFQSTPTGSSDNPIATSTAVYRNVTFTSSSISYGVQYLIEIGAGGTGAPGGSGTRPTGSNGSITYISSSNSDFPLYVPAYGGGGGGSDHNQNQRPSFSGASGGGNGGNNQTSYNVFIDGQGFPGSAARASWYPGSGGGAGGPGRREPADGGIGKRWDILGQEYWWCGGGAGAGYTARAGNGGKGGGGGGGPRVSGGGNGDASGLAWNNGADAVAGSLNSQTNVAGGSAGANTGGGGGGGSHYVGANAGGNGGSGMVILVLPKLAYSGVTTGDPIIRSGSVVGGSDFDHVALIFTQSGTYTTPLTGSLNY